MVEKSCDCNLISKDKSTLDNYRHQLEMIRCPF